jgi:hypothetical protein
MKQRVSTVAHSKAKTANARMGWFHDNHWAGQAYNYGMGYMAQSGYSDPYGAPRNHRAISRLLGMLGNYDDYRPTPAPPKPSPRGGRKRKKPRGEAGASCCYPICKRSRVGAVAGVPSMQEDVGRQHRNAATLQKPGKKDEVCDNNRRTHRPLPAAPSPLPPRLARRGNQANSKPDGGKVETSLADCMQMRQPGGGGGGGLNRLRMASRGAAG